MSETVATLKQKIEQLEEIHRLAQSLSSIVNVYETLEAIVGCCLRLCRAERGAILLFGTSPDDTAQTVARTARQDQSDIDHIVNSLVAGWVFVHKRPLLTDDVLRELSIRSPSERIRQLGPSLAVPLLSDGKPFGIIHLVNSRGGERFTQETLSTATALAPLAAQLILRAKFLESLSEANKRLKATLQHRAIDMLLGESKAMQDIRNKIMIAAPSNASVLLIGETGTGKEIAARAIHLHSNRADKPFIAVNCAAIPSTLFESELFGHEKGAFTGATATMKGKFELADEGTLFFDEVSAMPLDLQPKLLRVLEERRFCRVGSSVEQLADVRVIAATNRDLKQAVAKGEFREDLYHRLNVVPFSLPSLSERKEDIPLLANAFLAEFSGGAKHFSADALELVSQLEWKGNVRELRNTVERVMIFSTTKEVTADTLRELGVLSGPVTSPSMRSTLQGLLRLNKQGNDLLESIERDLVSLALEETHGNVTEAARLLGMHRNALLRRVEKYRLG